jgi:hypothetical protein
VAVAEEDARQGLHLDVLQGAPLGLREAPHLGLGEAHVGERLGIDPREAALDLRGVEPEAGRVPAVERVRVLAHGGVAALAHGGDDLGHGIRDGARAHCMRM